MRTQLLKEVRAVFPLWLLVTLAGLIPRLPYDHPSLRGLWQFLSVVGFYAGTALLATLPLGYEFQSRTFPSLLAQPVDRRRIWAMKTLVVAVTVITAGLAYWFGWQTDPYRDPETMITGVLWLVLAGLTAPFWTLVARSIIGGLAMNAVQAMLIVAGLLINDLLRRFQIVRIDEHEFVLAWIGIILIYSLLMFWLGRRALLRFQDSGTSDFLSGRPRLQPRMFAGWLHSRPNAPLFNLIAKETRLLWPVWVFISVGIFATAGLALWRLYEDPNGRTFAIISVTEFVVASLCAGFALFLSGTLSMGEERMLGVQAWHMTMPISFRTQWLLKFALVAGISIVGMTPLMMIGNTLTAPQFSVDFRQLLDPSQLWIAALTVVLGFWCGSVVKGTSRALIWLCPVIATLIVAATAGAGISTITRSHWLLNWLSTKQIQNLIIMLVSGRLGSLPIAILVLPVLVMAAFHSYRLFRIEVPEDSRLLVRGVVPLMLMALLSGFALQTIRQAGLHLLFPGQ